VVQIYQVRGAVEGLAARLAALAGADLSMLQAAVDGMREASAASHRDALLDCELPAIRFLSRRVVAFCCPSLPSCG
ncbi:MAG: FCD domain-containing protein, partial [Alloacidobacterium sp.]